MSIMIKICGITSPEDAQAAIEYGANYVGLIFAPSKRQIIKETAVRIKNANPSFNNFVGVFLNGKKKDIEETCVSAGISIIQLHGDETPAFCNYFINRGYTVIKVIRIKTAACCEKITLYEKVPLFLFDTYDPLVYGGTGQCFDWRMLQHVSVLEGKRYFISGGLDHTTISPLLTCMRPYGVDASSKLELSPGVKDKEKMKLFISTIRSSEIHG